MLWPCRSLTLGQSITDVLANRLVGLISHERLSICLAASAAVIHFSCLPLWAQQAEKPPNHTSSPEEPSNDRSTVAEHSAPKDSKLPVLGLRNGFPIHRVLGDEEWIFVSLSALSQNNGTTAGLRNNHFTSSNLFNLGLQIGPFDLRRVTQKSDNLESIPRLGMEMEKPSRFYQQYSAECPLHAKSWRDPFI